MIGQVTTSYFCKKSIAPWLYYKVACVINYNQTTKLNILSIIYKYRKLMRRNVQHTKWSNKRISQPTLHKKKTKESFTAPCVSGNRISDTVSSRRENQKQQTTNNSNTHWNNIQNLLGFLLRRRVETAQGVIVPHSHRTEDKHRQNSVDPVNEPDPVFT